MSQMRQARKNLISAQGTYFGRPYLFHVDCHANHFLMSSEDGWEFGALSSIISFPFDVIHLLIPARKDS